MAYNKHHGHEQHTGTHHGHQSSGYNPHAHVYPPTYTPHVQVSTPYVPHASHVTLVPTRRSYGTYRSYSTGTGAGAGVLLVGALIVIPLFVFALVLKLTLGAVGLAATSMASAGVAAAGAAGAFALSAGTFGIGALALYAALGLGYLYSSAKECYGSDKNVFAMIKSRVVHEDKPSFTGVIKSIGAALWSPFLLIGGLAGMGAKAVANAICAKPSTVKTEEPGVQFGTSPFSKLSDPSKKQEQRRSQDVVPGQFDSPLQTASQATGKGSHLLDSQIDFPASGLYPSLNNGNGY